MKAYKKWNIRRVVWGIGVGVLCLAKAVYAQSAENAVFDVLEKVLTPATSGYLQAPDKEAYLLSFLSAYVPGADAGEGDGLTLIIEKIRELKLLSCRAPLTSIRDRYFQTHPAMSLLINDTLTIHSLCASQQGLALYRTALVHANSAVREWALQDLRRQNTADSQVWSNTLLLERFAAQDPLALQLKEGIESDSFRSENKNPSFEFYNGGFNNWQVLKREASTSILPADGAHSFARCMLLSAASGETIVRNDAVVFSAGAPRAIEFGISYRMDPHPYYPGLSGGALPVEEWSALANHLVVRLRLYLTYSDGSAEMREAIEPAPFDLAWRRIDSSYRSTKSIRSAQLEIAVSGTGSLRFDDGYLRRADAEFIPVQPQITSVGASAATVISGEYVTFQAYTAAANSGVWLSDLQGTLGTGLLVSSRLVKPGKHTITFEAKGAFGATVLPAASMTLPRVTVIQPGVRLDTAVPVDANGERAVSGVFALQVIFSGLENNPVPEASCRVSLYANDRCIATASASPYSFNVDTSLLANGLTTFVARAYWIRNNAASSAFDSNPLVVQIGNSVSGIPRISKPSQNTLVTIPMEVEVTGGRADYTMTSCSVILTNVTTQRAYSLGPVTLAAGSAKTWVSPANAVYPAGTYVLTAHVVLRLPDGKTFTASCDPVSIEVAAPGALGPAPASLTATLQANKQVLLQWQDRTSCETGFVVERRAWGETVFTRLRLVGANTNYFLDTAPVSGGAGEYRVCAYCAGSYSAYSNIAGALDMDNVPAAPSGLQAVFESALAGVRLQWADVSSNEKGFRIERRKEGEVLFQKIAVTAANATGYIDKAVVPNARYEYRVSSFNDAGWKGGSPAVSVITAVP